MDSIVVFLKQWFVSWVLLLVLAFLIIHDRFSFSLLVLFIDICFNGHWLFILVIRNEVKKRLHVILRFVVFEHPFVLFQLRRFKVFLENSTVDVFIKPR